MYFEVAISMPDTSYLLAAEANIHSQQRQRSSNHVM
jgi:ribosomal protein L11